MLGLSTHAVLGAGSSAGTPAVPADSAMEAGFEVDRGGVGKRDNSGRDLHWLVSNVTKHLSK